LNNNQLKAGILKRHNNFQTAVISNNRSQVVNIYNSEIEEAVKPLLKIKNNSISVGVNGLTEKECQFIKRKFDASISRISTPKWVLDAFEIESMGLAVYADSFMVAAGREYENKTWTAGDWNPKYSRSGSIQDVILRCSNALVEDMDGRSKNSALRTILPQAAGTKSPEEYLEWVDRYSETDLETSLKVLSALTKASKSGDDIAQRVISVLGADIGQCAAAVISTLNLRLEKTVLPVHFGGEVFNRVKGIINPAKKRINHVLTPEVRTKYKYVEPTAPASSLAELASIHA